MMIEKDVVQVSSTGSIEVEDATLDYWDESYARRGGYRNVPPKDSDDPFDVEVAKPRAIDVVRLYNLAGQDVPANVAAALGPRIPVLLCYGMTPFYKAGREPTGIWGMGYEANIERTDCSPVSFFPTTRQYDIAKVTQNVLFGLSAGGSISLPDLTGLEATRLIPGIAITGAKIHATTSQEFAIGFECTFSILEVQVGPLPNGGARWNFYRGHEDIEEYKPLFQTILVPEGTKALVVSIDIWIRRSGRFFNWPKNRHWSYPSQSFEISLEGLSA